MSNDDLILGERRKLELLAEKDTLEKRKQPIEEMWQNPNEKDPTKKKRLVLKLIEENRIKNRKLGAGAKRLLDSDDKILSAKAIQENALVMGEEQV